MMKYLDGARVLSSPMSPLRVLRGEVSDYSSSFNQEVSSNCRHLDMKAHYGTVVKRGAGWYKSVKRHLA